MDDSLYDEFGNYIGPELKSSEEEESGQSEESDYESDQSEQDPTDELREDLVVHGSINGGEAEDKIVLHEDKKYYPDADEVYGEAEVLVMEEDSQTIETPIIAPVKVKNFSSLESKIPKTTYSTEFMTSLMDHPYLIRNVALIGDLHSGKTLFMDLLIEHTHEKKWFTDKLKVDHHKNYCDTRKDEQERKLSIKSTPVSLILETLRGKSYLVNMMDCPGHVNFYDETAAALQVSDGAVLVVDVVQGLLMNTERMIKSALRTKVPIVLVINKIDRLIVELKLPPADAYHKLVHTIEEVNSYIRKNTPVEEEVQRLSPELGNVCFASAEHGWCFSLESFAMLYTEYHDGIDAVELGKRLWGDLYYSPGTRNFKKKIPYENAQRSFVMFILEPIYKIYSQVLGEETVQLNKTLRRLGLRLRREQLNLNPRPLLKLVLSHFVGTSSSSLAQMVTDKIPNPIDSATTKIPQIYSNPYEEEQSKNMADMLSCNPKGRLMINIVKLYSSPDGESFSAFGRVLSGQIESHQKVKILGENYTLEDDEDSTTMEVGSLAISQGRYKIEVNRIPAGNWIILENIHSAVTKTATITDVDEEEVSIFKPLSFNTTPSVKLAVEPLNPSELPKMLEGLRKVSKSYPSVTTKVEESGEHVILCSGELSADCILHDLRRMYSEIEIKVADPVVAFAETVIDTSSVKCFAETPNRKNKLTMICEKLDEGLQHDIESEQVQINWSEDKKADFFETKYGWDVLASRSIWAFGPSSSSANVLLDDTLDPDMKPLLEEVKPFVVQGFQWGCREGPLCDEPIRQTKFKILEASIAQQPIHRGGGQLIPTARRVAYSSFLLASPRLLEPMYAFEIICPSDTVNSLYNVLSRRRGHITHDAPKPGSPFYIVRGYVPVIESFGLETDLRVFTQGQAFISQVFDHWAIVPGDPLDKSIVLRPLEPSPRNHLAREFMIKTRRRKGLSEEVNINKFFDDPMLIELAKQNTDLQNIL